MQTYKLIKRLADHVTFGKIAQLASVTVQTAEAWGREPESNANPFGTGRKNQLDAVLRLMALAHRDDPALCREMAELFTDYADFLDGQHKAKRGCLNELIGCAAKEHTDAIVKLLNNDPPDFEAAYPEIIEAQQAMARLKDYVNEERGQGRLQAV